jgi:hypothetical protein
MSRNFAVKRGRCLTLFAKASAAFTYCMAVLGSELLFRSKEEHPWQPLL